MFITQSKELMANKVAVSKLLYSVAFTKSVTLAPQTDNWPPTTDNCFSKSFPGPHTGCGLRRHNNLVLAIH